MAPEKAPTSARVAGGWMVHPGLPEPPGGSTHVVLVGVAQGGFAETQGVALPQGWVSTMAGVFCTYNDLSVLAPEGDLPAGHLLGVQLPLHLRVFLLEEVGGG